MVLVIDAQVAGISGDMFLCALVDLGANKDDIIRGVKTSAKFLGDGVAINEIKFEQTRKNGISATKLLLNAHDTLNTGHKERKGTDLVDAISNASTNILLSNAASIFASRCINILLDSESKVHGVSKNSVVFHEASGVDTLVDIIGTAIALDSLDLFDHRIVCMPVCVGGGTVSFSHGISSNPAYAVLEIFKKYHILIHGADVDSELVTPTGACILAALQPHTTSFYPPLLIDSVGYGAGCKNFDKFANVLKLVCGSESLIHTKNNAIERVCVLETNVDDATGEIIGNTINKIMNAGAKDVSVFQGLTKKNRPVNMISVMCDVDMSEKLTDLLMSETGTLGVRVSESKRVTVPRKQHVVNLVLFDKRFEIRYKTRDIFTDDDDNTPTNFGFKIEFDDLLKVSDAVGMPILKIEPILRDMIVNMDNGGLSSNTLNFDNCDGNNGDGNNGDGNNGDGNNGDGNNGDGK